MKIAILGAGAWGTALAVSACRNPDAPREISLWARDRRQANEMRQQRMNLVDDLFRDLAAQSPIFSVSTANRSILIGLIRPSPRPRADRVRRVRPARLDKILRLLQILRDGGAGGKGDDVLRVGVDGEPGRQCSRSPGCAQ